MELSALITKDGRARRKLSAATASRSRCAMTAMVPGRRRPTRSFVRSSIITVPYSEGPSARGRKVADTPSILPRSCVAGVSMPGGVAKRRRSAAGRRGSRSDFWGCCPVRAASHPHFRGEARDEGSVGGLCPARVDLERKQPVQLVKVAPVPRGLDARADGPLHPPRRRSVLEGDEGAQTPGDGGQKGWIDRKSGVEGKRGG